MILIGLDPGTQRTGYAVLKVDSRPLSQFELIEVGAWDLLKLSGSKSDDRSSLGIRLELLYQLSEELFEKHNPRWIGLEKAVAHKNIPSALKLSEARGVLRLAAYKSLASADSRLIELSPTQVKKDASGFGVASKSDVRRVLLLRFPQFSKQLSADKHLLADAYDALAIALSCWVSTRRQSR